MPLFKEVCTQSRLLEVIDNKANFKVTNDTLDDSIHNGSFQGFIKEK